MAGCHAQHQQTAFAKRLTEDGHPPVRATGCRFFREYSLLVERPFAAQKVVVVLREAVGFVANVFQQPQRIGVAGKS